MTRQGRAFSATTVVLGLTLLLAMAVPCVFAQEVSPPAPTPGAATPEAGAPGAPDAAPATPPKIDSGDTAWLLVSTALVLAMTAPGLALFYGGMVREKNALGTIMQSFIVLCLISVQWVLWGYSLAFGPDHSHIIGGLEWFGLNDVKMDAANGDYAPTIPHQAYMIFQMMFALT